MSETKARFFPSRSCARSRGSGGARTDAFPLERGLALWYTSRQIYRPDALRAHREERSLLRHTSKEPPLPPIRPLINTNKGKSSINRTPMRTPSLRIAVIGGRSFGKTTLATSLFSIAGNTNGTVTALGETQAILAVKNDQLAHGGRLMATGPDEIKKFRFQVRSASREEWTVSFKDYPGEFFDKYASLVWAAKSSENNRSMDAKAATAARSLKKSLLRNDALIVLLPWDIMQDPLHEQLASFKQRVCEFLNNCGAEVKKKPVCLAINKWDMNPDGGLTVDDVLADESKPFGAFFADLKQVLGDNLFCRGISAFGEHDPNDIDKRAVFQTEDGKKTFPQSRNVLEIILELARRIDQRRISALEQAWDGGGWFQKAVAVPMKSACARLRGFSSAEQAGRFKKYFHDGCRKFWKTAAAAIVIAGLGTLLFNAILANKRMSSLADKASNLSPVLTSDCQKIKGWRISFDNERWLWRFLFGRSVEQELSRAEADFNIAVQNNWKLKVDDSGCCDGTFDSMHPTIRLGNCQYRLGVTTNAVSSLLPASNEFSIRKSLEAFAESERCLERDLVRFREFDANVFERLESVDDAGERAKVLFSLLDEYRNDPYSRSNELARLQGALDSNQDEASRELDENLKNLESRLAGEDFSSALGRCTNQIARIDAMESRFVGTNFIRYAEQREVLFETAFAAATNEIGSIPAVETATGQSQAAERTIGICDQVANIWFQEDARLAHFANVRNDAQYTIRRLAPYVKWENDFATNVTATTGENGRASQLAEFLTSHRQPNYPDYRTKWEELNREKNGLVEILLSGLDRDLENSFAGTTNDIAQVAREAVSNRIASIEAVRNLLPVDEGRQIDRRLAEEGKRFKEIDKYERFDRDVTALNTVSEVDKIVAIDSLFQDYPKATYPRRTQVYQTLEAERNRLFDSVTNAFAQALAVHSDNPITNAIVRIAEAEARIAATDEVLRRIPGYSPALRLREEAVGFTNVWVKYAELERRWANEVDKGPIDERARLISEFLDKNPWTQFDRYRDKFDAASQEMSERANSEWDELTVFLETNRVSAASVSTNEHSRIAEHRRTRIEKARRRLPDTYSNRLDDLLGKVDREEAEGKIASDKYVQFDQQVEVLSKADHSLKIAKLREFRNNHDEGDYPERADKLRELSAEMSRLELAETKKYDNAIETNLDDTTATAIARIANAERRIGAANAILFRMQDYAPALNQRDQDISFTNTWTKYADLERRWRKEVEDGSADERARLMSEFLDANPKEEFPLYGERFDSAKKEIEGLAETEWSEVEKYLKANMVDFATVDGSDNWADCECAATNQLHRIEMARKRLPKKYGQRLSECQKEVQDRLEEARGKKIVEDAVKVVANTPWNLRLAKVADFRNWHSDVESRMDPIESATLAEIETNFNDRLSVTIPPSTNFTENVDYWRNRGQTLREKAACYPDGPAKNGFVSDAANCDREREKYDLWENYRKRIEELVRDYDENDPKETTKSLDVFNQDFTNKWMTSDAIHAWVVKRDDLQKKAEICVNSLRNEELQANSSQLPPDDKSQIPWYGERVRIRRQYNSWYCKGSEEQKKNSEALAAEEAAGKAAEDRVDFDKGYSDLQQSLQQNQNSPESCLKEITKFESRFTKSKFEKLSGAIKERYATIETKKTRLGNEIEWKTVKDKANNELAKKPSDTRGWESHRKELRAVLTRVESFLRMSGVENDALPLKKKIDAEIVVCNNRLGGDSYAAIEKLHQTYQSDPTPANFGSLNGALNRFDAENASSAEAEEIQTWRSQLREDARLFKQLKKAFDDFRDQPTKSSWDNLVIEYEGLTDGEKLHAKFSFGDPAKLEFWNSFQKLITSLPSKPSVHCRGMKVVLKGKKNHELKCVIGKITLSRISKSIPDPKKGYTNEESIDKSVSFGNKIEIIHNPEGHRNEVSRKTPSIDKFNILGKGLDTGKTVFPTDPIPLAAGSTIQFVFDGLPTLSIPDYNYEEKR